MADLNLRISDRPFIIAGPCSAESEEQVMQTATALVGKTDLFRAGVWKPRTRPGSFEGHGTEALKWVANAGRSLGIKTTVEVANPQHVELALEAGIDSVWIGARTTVNPFLVQELAEVLKGSDTPVLVKNPVNPDLGLWIGALERFQKSGVEKLAAVHRGFSTYEMTPYRNSPNWNIPIQLRTKWPDLPIYCDPSHICGQRHLLDKVAQRAIDLDLDGLMIEVHPDPEAAWSDADQQITPAALDALLEKLIWRNPVTENVVTVAKLEELRAVIDRLDHDIISQLAKRMEVSRKIGEHKKLNDLTILQPERWNEILLDRANFSSGKGITEKFVSALLDAIHAESIHQQTIVMNGDEVVSNGS